MSPASQPGASKDFDYRTHKSWSRQRRVVGKAEWMIPSAAESESTMKPRRKEEQEIRHGPASGPRALREALLRPRRDGKPHQRMSARYVRRQDFHPHHARQPVAALAVFNGPMSLSTRYAASLSPRPASLMPTCGTIRLKLFKIGAQVRIGVR
jgi:hypothetical protein